MRKVQIIIFLDFFDVLLPRVNQHFGKMSRRIGNLIRACKLTLGKNEITPSPSRLLQIEIPNNLWLCIASLICITYETD